MYLFYWRPSLSVGVAVLCFYSITGFLPLYCQISTDLDTILHTPIVIRNTLVGRLRLRLAWGQLQAKPKRLIFYSVILVTHRKSYIETTDRRNFIGKPSKWRWGRVLLWKNAEFCSVGGARSKKQHFSHFWGTLRLSYAQPTGNSLPQNQWYWWKAETLKVCLLLVWRVYDQAFGRYRPLKGAKNWSRDHKNLIFAYSLIPEMLFFRSTTKIMKLSRKTVSKQWRH